MKHRVNCPAKINLYLHVTGKDRHNYHLLDSLVAFVPDIFDTITIAENHHPKHELKVAGQWHTDVSENNILLKVLELMQPLLTKKHFSITLDKNIPVGAGLGGGSSNAASLIQFLAKHYAPSLSLEEQVRLASQIGADVAMFFYQSAVYAMGIGNVLQKIEKFPRNLSALLIYPRIALETKKVYAQGCKSFKSQISHNYQFHNSSQLISFLNTTSNMLYENSLDLVPELYELLSSLNQLKGCLFARMSGSGSACFGLFDDQHLLDSAYQNMVKQYKDFLIIKSRVI